MPRPARRRTRSTTLEPVPPELREALLRAAAATGYVFRKELRRAVIFGRNDLVQDAPDLPRRPAGLPQHAHVLQRRDPGPHPQPLALRPPPRRRPVPRARRRCCSATLPSFRALELKQRVFTKIRDREPRPSDADHAGRGGAQRLRRAFPGAAGTCRARCRSASPQLVLDEEGRLVVSNHRAMHLFGLSPRDIGRPFQDLEVSYRPVELRTHLDDAVQQRRSVWMRDAQLLRGGADPVFLDIQFVPLADEQGKHSRGHDHLQRRHFSTASCSRSSSTPTASSRRPTRRRTRQPLVSTQMAGASTGPTPRRMLHRPGGAIEGGDVGGPRRGRRAAARC